VVDPPGAYAGTMQQYLAELAAGCRAAHARGVRCANAGLSSAGMVWLLVDAYERMGHWQESARILGSAFDDAAVAAALDAALGGASPASAADVAKVLAAAKPAVDAARTLAAGWKAAGVDDVNFHWFERDEDALFEGVALLRATVGCNDVMTDAIGERTQDAVEATFKLGDAQDMGLTRVVWFSHATEGSASLVDASGHLTPSGEAFVEVQATLDCDG
ncbi:MAG TPA: hypothetical protein VHB21_16355, partial [Minicystis sp.]|nr:hypothetical protein [Minicystis sp.]